VIVRQPQPAGPLPDVPFLSLLPPGDPDIGFRESRRQVEQHDRRGSQLAAEIARQAPQVEAMGIVEAIEDRPVQGWIVSALPIIDQNLKMSVMEVP
jgi:hypothetical protein